MRHPTSTTLSAALTRSSRTAVGAVVLAVVLAACGGAADDSAPDAGAVVPADEVDAEHNQADIDFAQQMIPHHQQAVMMSEMAENRADSPGVVELAEQIEAAQGPEIQTMTTFLEVWGAGDADDMAGHDMDDMDDMGDGMAGGMPGMMSDDEMGRMEGAGGLDFDRMFLENMIVHHEGAIEMSEVEVRDGLNAQAIELAEEIAATQEAEIQRMQELLAEG